MTSGPLYRNLGIGRELVAFAERWARERELPEAYPALLPFLATPCDIVVYHKPL
ncbi:GNAT family N-acetyltransferase [Micromonospora sp. NPDC004704]